MQFRKPSEHSCLQAAKRAAEATEAAKKRPKARAACGPSSSPALLRFALRLAERKKQQAMG